MLSRLIPKAWLNEKYSVLCGIFQLAGGADFLLKRVELGLHHLQLELEGGAELLLQVLDLDDLLAQVLVVGLHLVDGPEEVVHLDLGAVLAEVLVLDAADLEGEIVELLVGFFHLQEKIEIGRLRRRRTFSVRSSIACSMVISVGLGLVASMGRLGIDNHNSGMTGDGMSTVSVLTGEAAPSGGERSAIRNNRAGLVYFGYRSCKSFMSR